MVSRRSFLASAGAAAAAAPLWNRSLTPPAAAAPATCELVLANRGLPGTVYAYVTGREPHTGRWSVLRADGSRYLPASPAARVPLPADCAIPVGGAGSARRLTLPRMFGARVYFVRDATLDFYLDPGPALVEPSFVNQADPNYAKTWAFCEFTFNEVQLFANISYVDLVTALPIGLSLEGDATHTVAPLPLDAARRVADGLAAQRARDGQPWDRLVIRDGGRVLRVVSPQNIMAPHFDDQAAMPFRGYWEPYVDAVWQKYRSTDLRIDLQGGRGVHTGRVRGDVLTFTGGHTFRRPTSRDVFTCNHGPFTNNPADPDVRKGLLARLAAGFNRSTLLTHPDQPNSATAADYYRDPTTNHWSRLVHANAPIGYAFPYDDVRPDGQPDVSGAAHDNNPRRFTVTVG
ncbi:glycoside hydrolase family 64 protein [Streptomyces sp. TRM 70351]|uniref:glycoside hydrolase family 64 protein n=1 Tax=Streptomyces sp. TRM 70351 TaxID=3116552 RepID=UPI002E7B4B2F|nr:glycoside hydrolase family 64 protein [Streptomyces sp. TRM 70351]MEE1928928.1 glycoside hydrolase family 64 protein [Streptomyces sp. TRM 70351]